jgi:hypothetical protein
MKRREQVKRNIFVKNAFLAFFVFMPLLLMTTFVFSADDDLELVISEIMYNPDGADGDREWIEVINIGSDIDIESIKKYKDDYVLEMRVCVKEDDDDCEKSHPIYFEKEELNISKDELIIMTNDIGTFKDDYPDFDGEILEVNFNLSNGDENFIGIYREDEDDKIEWIDRVEYSSDQGADGNGKSLEKIDLNEGDLAKNWVESLLASGTPGKEYSDEKPSFSDDLKISEVFPDPEGSDGDGEFIEIFNDSDDDIELGDWSLRDESEKLFYFDKDDEIEGNGFLSVSYDESKISLNNSGDEIVLLNPIGEEVDEMKYEDAPEGESFALNDEKKFQWTSLVTPGEKNEFPVVKKYPKKIKFNEILSNPDGRDDDAEWVELFNENDFAVDLSEWKIENSRTKIFEIERGEIGDGKLLVISIKDTSFSIKNSDEKLTLLNPNGDEVDEIEMVESALSGASFNRGGDESWSWSNYPTPGLKNKINHRPVIKVEIPDDFYEGMKMEFDASKTKDEDGDELKFRWEFGDEHKSYLEKATHVYEKTGEYLVVLRVDDGSIYTYKEFKIEVEKYPKREVRIVKFVPNPIGKDSEEEIIWLKNETKKKVNLKNWSVATGSSMSKLTNHPIYEDFIIRPGKTKGLERDDCKFSLLNKKGRVILRYPNGETADKVKYEKEKIEEGEILEIQNGELIWVKAELEIEEELVSQEMSDNTEESVGVQGVSFEKQLLKAVLNEDLQCCETLRKIVIDNWKYQNRHWLVLSKSILTQT